jgi:DNA polymerase III delta prime subunit
MSVIIKKAERKQVKLRLALMGPSGSGKTYSALALAKGLGKKILVIDTENHSASMYADQFNFDLIDLQPPYTIEKYLEAMKAGVDNKYDVIIIDSITHAWAGEGGLLDQKSTLDRLNPRSNQFTNWGAITSAHEKFKAYLLYANSHLISTMRSKQEYVIEEEVRNGKTIKVPRKLGMAPIQREGMEYEFGVVLDLNVEHYANVTKTRISFLDGKSFIPSEEIGKQLLEWVNTGAPADTSVFTPGVDAETKVKLDEIKRLLLKGAKGDTQNAANLLMLITEHKVNGQTEWVKPEELDLLAVTKPVWIDTILNKLKKEVIETNEEKEA